MNMDQFTFFLLEAIPLTILIGITAATIGYTAWAIAVPLLFVGLGFPIFDALFISLAVDLVNSIILTIIYSKKDKVDFKNGIKYGLFAVLGSIIGVIIAVFLLLDNQDIFRGSVGYVFLILGVFFFYRAYNTKKKSEDPEPVVEDNKKEFSSKARVSIMIIGSIFFGLLSGAIGIGGGSNFTLLFIFLFGAPYGFDTLRSTGTGCFIMLCLSAFLVVVFGILATDIVAAIPYLIVMVLSSTLGAIIGAKMAVNLKEWKLNVMIGVAIILAAIVGSIQTILL